MLSENFKTIRKSKGLSQDVLAIKLNGVRLTVSNWERGLSVPDSEMLISISEALETPVSTLLGENIEEPETNELKAISEKLEVINLQLAQRKERSRKLLRWFFFILCAVTVIIFAVIGFAGSPYLGWDFSDPEIAVAGTILHGFEWVFVRIAPLLLIGGIIGLIMTRRKE